MLMKQPMLVADGGGRRLLLVGRRGKWLRRRVGGTVGSVFSRIWAQTSKCGARPKRCCSNVYLGDGPNRHWRGQVPGGKTGSRPLVTVLGIRGLESECLGCGDATKCGQPRPALIV